MINPAMKKSEPQCPSCQSPDCYHDGTLWICPLCNHEWTEQAAAAASTQAEEESASESLVVKDGDAVVVIKDLPVKGASGPIKGGTKVKTIRIAHDVPGHNIVCRIEGFGQIHLKSEYVKKA